MNEDSVGERGGATNDVLVRGGVVVDGTGTPGFRADVRVRGGIIAEVGPDLSSAGEPEIDAAGAVVTPGFFESHTHVDPSMFWNAACDPMPQHGVTTVLFGNCGLSLAPVRSADVAGLTDVFCYIEDMPIPVFDAAIPWTWETYAEYLDAVDSRRCAVNTSSLIGHSVIRVYVIGEAAWERPSTADETRRMAAVLDDALAAGAMGLSTSLGFDTDRNKRLVPSRLADDAELRALFEVLARRRGLVQFIASTVPKYLPRDVGRVAEISRGLDLTQTWINLVTDERRPEHASTLLELAADLQGQGIRSIPQVSPRPFDIEVNWQGGMSFYTMERSWHAVVQADPARKRLLLNDPDWRAIARQDWDAIPFTMVEHHRPERIVLSSVASAELEPWVGRTFAELCAERGGHPSDVLADWVLENDLQPGIVGTAVANGDADGVAHMLQHPAAVVSNSDAGAHIQMMCADGDTTLLLTRFVRERGDLTLEAAVRQLTARQAEVFGYPGRGTVRVGGAGDLTVFALDELSWDAPVFVDDLPLGGRRMRRPAGGYRATIVDGVPTQLDGELTGARPGRLLRSGRHHAEVTTVAPLS